MQDRHKYQLFVYSPNDMVFAGFKDQQSVRTKLFLLAFRTGQIFEEPRLREQVGWVFRSHDPNFNSTTGNSLLLHGHNIHPMNEMALLQG